MVYVMLADGFEEIECLSVVDILRRGGVEVKMTSLSKCEYVCGAHDIKVIPDTVIDEIEKNEYIEAIILPGGMPGTLNLKNNNKLTEILRTQYNKNTLIAAICAAPMILGELYFLKSKKATCYPSFETHLIDADFSLDRVCVDGNIITSRGAGTAHDFGFEILKSIKGENCSDEIRKSMLYDC